MTTTDTTRLAVLIDSDNTTASLTTELLEEIAKYGTTTIKRAYPEPYVDVRDEPGPSGLSRLCVRLKPAAPKPARARSR